MTKIINVPDLSEEPEAFLNVNLMVFSKIIEDKKVPNFDSTVTNN